MKRNDVAAASEERVTALEGRVHGHSQALTSVRESVLRLEERFSGFERRVDDRFADCERRFDAVDKRFDAVDARFDRVDVRLDRAEDRIGRQFVWTLGILLTMLATIVGGFLSA